MIIRTDHKKNTVSLEDWVEEIPNQETLVGRRLKYGETLRAPASEEPDTALEMRETLAQFDASIPKEMRGLVEMLQMCEGNESEVARRMGISHQAISKQISKLRQAVWPFMGRG